MLTTVAAGVPSRSGTESCRLFFVAVVPPGNMSYIRVKFKVERTKNLYFSAYLLVNVLMIDCWFKGISADMSLNLRRELRQNTTCVTS